MSTRVESTHVERTKNITRNKVVSSVLVVDICKLSPTVKGFTLHIENKSLTFSAGQWVDLSIPSEDIIGGYTFTSPPHQLRHEGTATLAIQNSDHPPTSWMSNKCKTGDRLSITVGGGFIYDPPCDAPADLLLIAGGVGINPLFSMLQHHAHILQSWGQGSNSTKGGGHVQLMYSAKSREELLFKDHIDELVAQRSGLINARYFVTREKITDPNFKTERIGKEDINHALSLLDVSRLQCYICGPPPMTEDMLTLVTSCGVDSKKINYEKWW